MLSVGFLPRRACPPPALCVRGEGGNRFWGNFTQTSIFEDSSFLEGEGRLHQHFALGEDQPFRIPDATVLFWGGECHKALFKLLHALHMYGMEYSNPHLSATSAQALFIRENNRDNVSTNTKQQTI